MPTALASVMNVAVEDIFDYLGHDGTEIIWPELPKPYCYRSFHIQEMCAYALMGNYAITTFTPMIGIAPRRSCEPHVVVCPHYADYTTYYQSVLTGTSAQGNPHAVAWDGKQMMDPSVGEFITPDFDITHTHVVIKIK